MSGLPVKALGASDIPVVESQKLKPLQPEDLAAPERAPSAAGRAPSSEPISFREVYEEMKMKLRDSIMESSYSKIVVAMRAINILVAVLMVVIAIAEIVTEDSFWSGVNNIFSVLYTVMFALILMGYEFRTPAVDLYLREYFGFMYGPKGRCLFLILISIFPIGMVGIYGILVSCIGFANAYFNYFVITKHPSFTRGIPDYQPPTSASNSDASSSIASRN